MYSGLELLEKLDQDILQEQLVWEFAGVVSVHSKVVSWFLFFPTFSDRTSFYFA